MRLPVRDDREILMKVLQYGAQARVIGPQGLKDRVRQETEKVVNLYL
jgi:predicted DNA-binding transcriptional regulator YafY